MRILVKVNFAKEKIIYLVYNNSYKDNKFDETYLRNILLAKPYFKEIFYNVSAPRSKFNPIL